MNVMVCDMCNAETDTLTGTVYSPEEFRQIVRRGFGPSREAVTQALMMGLTEEQYVLGWKNNLVEQSPTPWLLCPSCAARAREYDLVGLVH